MYKLNQHQITIMGKPNFACATPAKILIAAGEYEDQGKKAEYEQAVFIHWALGLYELYGENWADKGSKIIDALLEKLKEKDESNV